MAELRKLEKAEFSAAWSSESDFTDWLAGDDGIELLSGALQMPLEAVATEQSIGSFRADLICRDTTEDSLVVVENQLGTSDHKHLGQTLTYSAGVGAGTVVWIAEEFKDEHRAAVDRYNETTIEQIRFYALEIELWKMGDGALAPRLNVVSQPNDWRKVVSIQTEEAEEKRDGFDFFGFWVRVNEKIEPGRGIGKTRPNHRDYAFFDWKLPSQFKLGASIYPGVGRLRVDFSVQGKNRLAYATALFENQDEIELEVGTSLKWQLHERGRRSMVMLDRMGVDLNDTSQWDEYAEWMVEHLSKLRQAFWDRVDVLETEAAR